MSENPFEGWTTIEEAADIVGRTKGTVRFWANRGKITSHYVGRKMRVVKIEEVRQYSQDNPGYRRRRMQKSKIVDA